MKISKNEMVYTNGTSVAKIIEGKTFITSKFWVYYHKIGCKKNRGAAYKTEYFDTLVAAKKSIKF